MSADERYTVPALTRGLQLLTMFTREERELSGAELARRLKAPRASVFRLLHTLEQMGFVERVGDAATYRLGVAVLRLGFEYLSSLDLTEHARPLLDALRDATGYSSHLVVRDGKEVVFVAKAASRNSLFHSIQVGARLPAHATVLGRVLLGDLETPALEALFGTATLPAYTSQTPTTVAALRAVIEADRLRGYGISEGGYESGISTIAAPVAGEAGRIVAAVSITVPSQNIEPALIGDLVSRVRSTAASLAERLRHQPQSGVSPRQQKLAA